MAGPLFVWNSTEAVRRNWRDAASGRVSRRPGLVRALLVLAGMVAATFLTAAPASAASCSAGAVNVVAHPDDDLFFINPAIVRDIKAGKCSTTVYVTAGDAGGTDAYYQGREVGAQAAYAQMAGVADVWTTSRVVMAGKTVTRAQLTARPNVELYFMRLPDGYPEGTGSTRSNYTSLQKLYTGEDATLSSTDGSQAQTYTRAQLVATLGALMTSASPSTIRTLDHLGNFGDGDHSDHYAVGRFAAEARTLSAPTVAFAGYKGYDSEGLPANVVGDDLEAKRNALFAYAAYDSAVCTSAEQCSWGAEGAWLQRSYLATGEGAVEPPPSNGTNVASLAKVTASSQNTETQQTAAKAVDGVVDGYPGDYTAEWATQGQGVGAWLQLTWATPVELNRVLLHDRPNEYDQVTGATLTFSDGSTVTAGELENLGAATPVTFPARSVTSVRIAVTSVSQGTSNAGLSEVEAFTDGSVPDPEPEPQPQPLGGNVAPAAAVTVSSQNAETAQTSAKAVDGVIDGYPGDHTAEWATQGEGAGAWIQLTWASPVTLGRVVLYDRPNEYDQVTGATIAFSDGTTVAVDALDNAGAAALIDFPARTTTSVRITLTAVSAYTSNAGLSEVQAWTTATSPAPAPQPQPGPQPQPEPGPQPEPQPEPQPGPQPELGANVASTATATASSENVWDGQTAAKAIDGVADGYPGDYTAEWATLGERAGAWLQLDWAAPVELTRVVLYDRPTEWEQVTGATLTFSDGSSVPVPELENSGAAVAVDFPARSVSWVRVTLTSVGQWTGNAGLAEVETWTTPAAPAPTGPSGSSSAPAATEPAPEPASEPAPEPEVVVVPETTSEPAREPEADEAIPSAVE